MDKDCRNLLFNTTQAIRRLLEEEFSLQLEGTFDIHADGRVAEHPGSQLSPVDQLVRRRMVEAIQHRLAVGESAAEAVRGFQSEAVFTFLNRLAALKMMEARTLVRPCVSQGDQSQGFKEFSGLAPGLIELPDKGYRLYLECLFDEIGREVGVLFDRTDAASQLWPRRKALEAVLAKLNTPELAGVWAEDETIGWIYQYYNDPEERKQMREESSAPRNSRELAVRNQFLAVRNQFFTPRYVVEFLTDNTLGRTWYEMTHGQTCLKDRCRYLVRRPNEIFLGPASEVSGQHQGTAPAKDSASTPNPDAEPCTLSQEELLKQPVHIAHRPLKDPREIRLLDPACGSMHFGLYAFDLFAAIYEEAWDMARGGEVGAGSTETFASFVTFAASFPDKAAFLREVPRLIVENNIHGIDIDPRAAQIAGLALWLRAQRAWQEMGIQAAIRPSIRRSNIVCAEPMPGEKDLLRDFVQRQFPPAERPLFQSLLENIWDKMRLAGEAGSLLKIEEEIRSGIEEARQAFQRRMTQTAELFSIDELNRVSKAPELAGLDLAVSSLPAQANPLNPAADFWHVIEERIYAALRDYAQQAEPSGGFQRRLFADDAAQGFAFIDLCRKRYDVVVMNPPFGLMGVTAYKYAVGSYPNSYCDFGIALMDRGLNWTGNHGLAGAITSRSFLSVTDAEKFRVNVAIPTLRLIVDLGLDVMDGAWVDSCCQIFTANSREAFIQFVKARGETLTPELLGESSRRILRDRSDFLNMPRSRLSYEVGSVLANVLAAGSDGIEESGIALNRTGASTFEDERFRRIWWEVRPDQIGPKQTWCYVAKSCEFNLFYYPYENLVKWNGNGDELAERNRQVNEQTAQARQGSTFYFKPGLSFSRRGEPTIAFRTYPASCAFSSNGAVVLPYDMKDALYILGFLNSSWIRAAVHTQAHKFSYSVGHPKAIKWIAPSREVRNSVEESTRGILEYKRRRFSKDDRDSNFVLPFDPGMSGIKQWFQNFSETCRQRDKEMEVMLQQIDSKIAQTYALSAEQIDWKTFNTSVVDVHDPEDIPFSSTRDFGACLFSYLVGAIFGRWDIRYATGERAAPELPDPFAPLPVCPPGMLQGDDGLPLSLEAGRRLRSEGGYPLDVAWDGILVDDPGHPWDIIGRVQESLAVVWHPPSKWQREWQRRPAAGMEAQSRDGSATMAGPIAQSRDGSATMPGPEGEWQRRPAAGSEAQSRDGSATCVCDTDETNR
jgi:hypothetical protein